MHREDVYAVGHTGVLNVFYRIVRDSRADLLHLNWLCREVKPGAWLGVENAAVPKICTKSARLTLSLADILSMGKFPVEEENGSHVVSFFLAGIIVGLKNSPFY